MFARQSREASGLFISCLGATGMLYTFAPVLMHGSVGMLLMIGAGLGALLTIITELRFGKSLALSMLTMVIAGTLALAGPAATYWYISSLVPPGQPVIQIH